MGHLSRTQVDGDLPLQRLVHLVHVVHHQDVLGRDGAVGFELEAPVAFRVLGREQSAPGTLDRLVEDVPRRGTNDRELALGVSCGWNHQSISSC